ncbi:helix-turn-helix domain-containing protein [Alteromonadaceae bacterium M269]|nr:helix-turn-helix domain-containing protein [Alteromonadaceae bacterium M269]
MSTNNNGVVFYNVSINEFTHFHELQGLDTERCDFFTVVNREVFATCNNGLFSINVDTKRVNQHLNNQGVFEDYTSAFNTIASDEQGRIWFVGDTDLLYYYQPETLSLVQVDTGDTSFLGKAVLSFDTSERLWISAEDKVYLVERVDDNYRFSMVEQDVKHRPFFSVAEDYEGNIWFGGDTLLTYDSVNKKISYPYAMYPLLVNSKKNISDPIVDIASNEKGQLFVLSEEGVTSLTRYKDAISYLALGGKPRSYIEYMFNYGEGTPVFNINEQVLLYDDSTSKYIVAEGFSSLFKERYKVELMERLDNDTLIFVDSASRVYLAETNKSEVAELDMRKLGLPLVPNETQRNNVSSIILHENNNVIVSLLNDSSGIYRGTLDGEFDLIYPEVKVYSSLLASNGSVFFSVLDLGVLEYTKDKNWVVWNSLSDSRVSYSHCLIEGKNARIWTCDVNNGLGYLDVERKTIRYLDSEKIGGMTNLNGMVEDDEGYLWVIGNKGVVRYSPEDGSHILLGKESGISDNSFKDKGIYKISDGRLVVSGYNFNYLINTKLINPLLNNRLEAPLTAEIVETKITTKGGTTKESLPFMKSDLENNSFDVSYEDFLISFHFGVNDFSERNRLKFEYRLLGLDDEWLIAENGTATFSTLPAGEYSLETRVIDGLSHSVQPITRLPIKVHPPYWLTWQAYVLYVFLALISFYGVYRYRVLQLTRVNLQLEKAVLSRTQELTERTSELSESHTQISNLLAQKESLFANVSHEFRTPLTLILGPMSQLRPKLADDSDIQQFDMMQRNTKRLVQLVEQILELARLDTAVESPKQIYAIDSALGILVNSFKPLAELKSQEIVFTNHCSGGLELTADALEKILYNLLSNAIKYSPEGGTITVTGEQANNQYRLSIQDTGYGIPEDELETIFERFTRLEKTSEQLGSGLGLAVVKELVQANEGKIEVESELSKGTTFTVTFPLLSDFNENEATPLSDKLLALDSASELVTQTVNSSLALDTDSKSKESSKPVLLIIEDNQDMQTYIKQPLDSDYECITANNGQQGIDMAVEHIPDMILSDLMMPLKGGFEVVDHLRANELTAHIPITLLTAKGDDNSRLTGWQKTVDDYIAKPFNVEELKLRLSRLLTVRDIVKKRVTQQLGLQHNQEVDVTNEEEQPTLTFNSKRDEQFYNKLMQVIEDNYTDSQFGRPQAADALAVSERQLNRKLSAIVEYNFAELVRKHRLEKAKQLLLEGHQIGEVAYDVGFTSPSYFSRCFKAEFGLSPKELINRSL